ncbi:M16 family metallopeptidase [Luteithermobacter gelatinilyticus]|uniref:M16 family metallopeptidase n=1 Tax=Luteithermobacter gelatinilyticus TaxID=2582913 RepID=UPI001105E4E8|nr:pitrilysin family protein [Luteithermobacter gelatinilyticus]
MSIMKPLMNPLMNSLKNSSRLVLVIGGVIGGLLGLFLVPARADIPVQKVITPLGIEAWLVENHTIPLISMKFAFQGGEVRDPVHKQGLSTMVAALLDEGAGDMDARAFQTALENKAIKLGFSSRRERLEGSLKTLSENRHEAFRLLSLALNEPRFDQDAIERIRQQMLTILIRKQEDPGSIASKIFREMVYPEHPYGRDGDGTKDTIRALTRDDLVAYREERLTRDRLVIGVVGDITAQELAELLDLAFGRLADEAIDGYLQDVKAKTPGAVYLHRHPGHQSTILFGHQGLKRLDPDWYAAYVMNYILGGGGLTSRLAESVREEKGLAYSVGTSFQPMEYGGLFIGSLGTQNERATEAIALVQQEIRNLVENGVSEEELQDAKTYLTGSYALNFATSGAIASQLIGAQILGFEPSYFARRNEYINNVTREQIGRVARRLLHPDRLFWVVVGDPAGLDDLPLTKLGQAGKDAGAAH